MQRSLRSWRKQAAGLLVAGLLAGLAGGAPGDRKDTLTWSHNPERVTADITGAGLEEVLRLVAEASGWQVYMQPHSEHSANVKFRDRAPDEALKLLLGDLSFAILPQTNGPSRLLVFRNRANDATQLVASRKSREDTSKPIPNEVIVTLKPGARIEDLAKKLGATVTGRIDELNTYRLKFETAEAAEAARKALADNPEVASVDNNFNTNRPPNLSPVDVANATDFSMTPSSPNDCTRVTIGLIDTAIPRTGSSQEAFLLPSIDVAGTTAAAAAGAADTTPPHGEAMYKTILNGYQYSVKGAKTAPIMIQPVNVYGPNAQATTFDVASGILRAINAGAKIINLSLGSQGSSSLLADIIAKGQAQDVIFIAAAGNEPVTTPTFPAALPGVIAVTASDRSGQVASYANRGDFIDVIAPGVSIFSAEGQRWMSTGTSVSTAYVSGLAAAMADPCKKAFSSVDAAIRQNLKYQAP
jgi:hypothetical protein